MMTGDVCDKREEDVCVCVTAGYFVDCGGGNEPNEGKRTKRDFDIMAAAAICGFLSFRYRFWRMWGRGLNISLPSFTFSSFSIFAA